MKTAGSTGRSIGSAELRREDRRLLAGRGRYGADISLPDMLEAAFVRSTLPHARLEKIDSQSALKLAGVATILTTYDLPRASLWYARLGGEANEIPLTPEKIWLMLRGAAKPGI